LLSDGVDIDHPYGNVLSLEVASDDKRNYRNFEKRIQEAFRSSGTLRRNMALFVFDELLLIKGDMGKEEAEFRHKIFGNSARNFMDSAEEVGVVPLPIVEDTMTWMFGEEKKMQFPSVWNNVDTKLSVKLNQTDDELKNTVNSMMRHRTAQDETI
jgi:hypothetical protein